VVCVAAGQHQPRTPAWSGGGHASACGVRGWSGVARVGVGGGGAGSPAAAVCALLPDLGPGLGVAVRIPPVACPHAGCCAPVVVPAVPRNPRPGLSGHWPGGEARASRRAPCRTPLCRYVPHRTNAGAAGWDDRSMIESVGEVRAALARTGHGHVVPTTSGLVARCGGPALCSKCATDAARLLAAAENVRHAA
jgi:hypothetical protein